MESTPKETCNWVHWLQFFIIFMFLLKSMIYVCSLAKTYNKSLLYQQAIKFTCTWHSVLYNIDSIWCFFNIFTCLCNVLLKILLYTWPRKFLYMLILIGLLLFDILKFHINISMFTPFFHRGLVIVDIVDVLNFSLVYNATLKFLTYLLFFGFA